MTLYSLVGDIGGTNSRFALSTAGHEFHDIRKYPNAQFPGGLQQAITHYLTETGQQAADACIAVAGPIMGDRVTLTNIDWSFSTEAMRQHFGWNRLKIVNDFTALAMAVPYLPPQYLRKLYGGDGIPNLPISVVGPGTGLGVGGLLWTPFGWTALQGEGGNTAFAPLDAFEDQLLAYARSKIDYVRTETFVSGSGLPLLHEAALAVRGKPLESLKPDEIALKAFLGESEDCVLTLNTFCGMLGSFMGDQALVLGSHGGCYIGGGIIPQLGEFFTRSPFRERFLAKGKFEKVLKDMPIHLMLSFTETALLGAAAILHPK